MILECVTDVLFINLIQNINDLRSFTHKDQRCTWKSWYGSMVCNYVLVQYLVVVCEVVVTKHLKI